MYLKQSWNSLRVPATQVRGGGGGLWPQSKISGSTVQRHREELDYWGLDRWLGHGRRSKTVRGPLGLRAPHIPPGAPAAPSCGLQARSQLLTLGPRHGALRPSPCLLLPTLSEGLELRSYCLRLRGSREHTLFSHVLRSPACLCTQPYFFQCLSLPKRL